MKKLAVILALLLFVSLPAWAESRPARTRAVSPDGKLVVVVERNMDGEGPWNMGLYNRQYNGRPLLCLSTQNAEKDETWNDAFGIYDFYWSPDSRLVLFVFRPYWSFSIGHSCDSIGVVDVQTKQWQWIAGKAVDGMHLDDYFGNNNPDFKLRWRDSNTVSFYMPKTSLHEISGKENRNAKSLPAGIRTVSVAKIREEFVTRAKAALGVIGILRQLMVQKDWQTAVRSLMVPGDIIADCSEELGRHRGALVAKNPWVSFDSWNHVRREFTLIVRHPQNEDDFVQVVVNSQGKIVEAYQWYDYD